MDQLRLVVGAPFDDVPDIAVGEYSEGARLCTFGSDEVATQLVFRLLDAGLVSAFEVVAQPFGFDDGAGRFAAG